MKSISFFVLFLFSTSIYCQPKYLSYKSSYFKDKEFEIRLSFEDEKRYTLYIDMQSRDNISQGGLVITHEVHKAFLDTLLKVKDKLIEWVNVAKNNNVIEVSKKMEVDFIAPACYFKMSNETFNHRGSNLVFIFSVMEGKTVITIWTQNLTASENKYISNRGFFLAFTSEKEISDFIDKISVQKVKDFIKKPKTSDLFKN